MFSPKIALKVSALLSSQAEQEIGMLMDDLIQTEMAKIHGQTPDAQLREIAIRIDTFKRLKEYKKYIEGIVSDSRRSNSPIN